MTVRVWACVCRIYAAEVVIPERGFCEVLTACVWVD